MHMLIMRGIIGINKIADENDDDNDDGDDFSVRALIPQFSCAASHHLIGTNIMVVNIIIITITVVIMVKFDS